MESVLASITIKITDYENERLTRRVTYDEVKTAIFSMHLNNKYI